MLLPIVCIVGVAAKQVRGIKGRIAVPRAARASFVVLVIVAVYNFCINYAGIVIIGRIIGQGRSIIVCGCIRIIVS